MCCSLAYKKKLAWSIELVLESMDSGLHNGKISLLGCMLHGQYKQCAVHWLIKTIGIEHKASFRRHGFRSSQWKNWPVRLFAAWTIQAMCCSLAYQNCVLFIGLSKPLALSIRQHLSCWLNVLDLLLSIDGSWVPSYQSWVSVRQLYLEIYITCNSLLALVIE